jgi:multisubunit Na+/H+ antiporter MnhC subunit
MTTLLLLRLAVTDIMIMGIVILIGTYLKIKYEKLRVIVGACLVLFGVIMIAIVWSSKLI